MEGALSRFFNHEGFREGQKEVVEAIAQRRDSLVFWATGSGKSLVYQLPALQSGKVCVVCSPLISLMQDQVLNLNNTVGPRVGRKVAAFLGSAQFDPTVEADAFSGKFNIVYMSPEKLLGGSTIDGLSRLHKAHGICLFAIDEAHCVSEWGHDFRPEYQKLSVIRNTNALSDVPIACFTATATMSVRNDIARALQLRSPAVFVKSFDRDNFRISVRRRESGGPTANLAFMKRYAQKKWSTIVYVPTTSLAEDLVPHVKSIVAGTGASVAFYHGKMEPEERRRVHVDFLVGKVHIVVATIAFGMGIDKPDIRVVVHYGAPQTVEGYYQQIGRAGRDGLEAHCHLVYGDGDFQKYLSSFYTDKLSSGGLKIFEAGVRAMQEYTINRDHCRRKMLLNHFDEKSNLQCGICDNCIAYNKHEGDTKRDFSTEAMKLLRVVSALASSGKKTTANNVVAIALGKSMTSHSWLVEPIAVSQEHRSPLACGEDLLKELIVELVSRQVLAYEKMSRDINGYKRTWDNLVKGPGFQQMIGGNGPILFPVPQCVRVAEAKEEERRQRVKKELADGGAVMANIPESEIRVGDGPVMRAELAWMRYLKSLTDSGKTEKVAQLEDFLGQLLHWRLQVAERLTVAPTVVLPEHVAKRIAQTRPKDADALEKAGVRVCVGELIDLIRAWEADHGLANETTASNVPLGMPSGMWKASAPWKHAVYSAPKPIKSGKNSGKLKYANWEQSWMRFKADESVTSIAFNQESGKSIQPSTVCKHLLQALTYAFPLNLTNLVEQAAAAGCHFPSRKEYDEFLTACNGQGLDCDSPNTTSAMVVGAIYPDLVSVPRESRTPEQQTALNGLYFKADVVLHFQRARVPVQTAQPSSSIAVPSDAPAVSERPALPMAKRVRMETPSQAPQPASDIKAMVADLTDGIDFTMDEDF